MFGLSIVSKRCFIVIFLSSYLQFLKPEKVFRCVTLSGPLSKVCLLVVLKSLKSIVLVMLGSESLCLCHSRGGILISATFYGLLAVFRSQNIVSVCGFVSYALENNVGASLFRVRMSNVHP